MIRSLFAFLFLFMAHAAFAQNINGQVRISPALQGKVNPSAVLFVIARPEGVKTGAPLAVVRIANPKFPQDFEIGPKNVMAGGEFKGKLVLTAKLSFSGDPITAKGDLLGEAIKPMAVAPGSKDVNLVLNKESR